MTNSRSIEFTVPGKPMGKQRPRFARVGKFVKTHTPKETVAYETQIKERFAAEFPDHVPFEGPIDLSLVIFMPILASTPKKHLQDMRLHKIRPTKKPDLDNVLKIVCDALNEIAFKDDKQVVFATISKVYDDQPRIAVRIEPIEETDYFARAAYPEPQRMK